MIVHTAQKCNLILSDDGYYIIHAYNHILNRIAKSHEPQFL